MSQGEQTPASDNQLVISNHGNTDAAVNITSPRSTTPLNQNQVIVPAGLTMPYFVPFSFRASATGVYDVGILVESDTNVTVAGVNIESQSMDGFLAFAVDGLRTEYYTSTYWPSESKSQIGIAATADDTRVAVTLPMNQEINVWFQGKNFTGGMVIPLHLQLGQVFQCQAVADLTGVHVVSDKAIAVYSGNDKANIGGTYQDHLVAQLPPVSTWGRQFRLISFPDQSSTDVFQVITSEINTTLAISGQTDRFFFSRGDHMMINITSDLLSLVADKPVMILQYSNKNDLNPSMILITPVEQFSSDYRFSTLVGTNGTMENYLLIVSSLTELKVRRNGGPPLNISNYASRILGTFSQTSQVAIVTSSLPQGQYTVFDPDPTERFGLVLYGRSSTESYGFPAGMMLDSINVKVSHDSIGNIIHVNISIVFPS